MLPTDVDNSLLIVAYKIAFLTNQGQVESCPFDQARIIWKIRPGPFILGPVFAEKHLDGKLVLFFSAVTKVDRFIKASQPFPSTYESYLHKVKADHHL